MIKSPLLPPKSPGGDRAVGTVGRAFTLIELLAVIAIIAVLAALIMPMLSGMKEKGLQAKCMANMRQLAAGFRMLASENNNTISVTYGGLTPSQADFWTYQLYVGGGSLGKPDGPVPGDVFRCPSLPVSSKWGTGAWNWFAYGLNLGPTAYSANTWSSAWVKPLPVDSSRNLRELNLARVEKPSACLLLADSYSPSYKAQTFRLPENSGTLDGVHMRHSGHANAVFLDGHGEVLMNADDVKKTGTFWLYDQDTTLPGTKLR